MAQIPANYRALGGGERRAVPGARYSGPADPKEQLSLSICVRPRSGAPPLPGHEHWAATPPAQRKYLSREELAAQHGAAQDDLDRVAEFLTAQGFTVTETSAARRLMKVTGNVETAQRTFAVDLGYYELDEPKRHEREQPRRQRYRSHEGSVYIPAELAGVITGVFGLDNRVFARRSYDGPPPGIVTPLAPRDVAALYRFPLDPPYSNAKGETVAVLEFNSYFLIFNETSGFQQSDIDGFVTNLMGTSFKAPQVVGVSIDNEPIQMIGPGVPGDPSIEVALDIEMVVAIAQGAGVVAYFSQNNEMGWIDAVSSIVADTVNDPSILSISWGGNEDTTWPGFPQQLTQYFQSAAAIGMTVFAGSGDTGSNCFATDTYAHVNYPASDPWVTACGGTTLTDIQQPLGMTFKEITWNDSWGATGGGISTQFAQPSWQAGANLPISVDPNRIYGRGVPDISGNASPFSGYYLWVYGQQTGPVNGTSSVGPLYAALTAIMNSKLGYRVGYLNPSLYALGTSGVFNDIDDGANNEYLSYPDLYYVTGPGWDACTGWGSVKGSPLLAALRGGVAINTVDSTPMTPAVCVFQNMLYLFWKANDPTNRIYWSGSADGLQWPGGQLLDTVDCTPQPLAAVPFNNDVYLFWKANDPSNSIYYSSFLFPGGQKINNTDTTPLALTACVQLGMVNLFWRSNDSSDTVYYSASGDFSVPWPGGTQAAYGSMLHRKWEYSLFVTGFAPAVALAANGDMVLFWTANADGPGTIYTSDMGQDPLTSGGRNPVAPGANAQTGPAACLFNQNMYVFWTAGNTIFFSVSTNGIWSAPVKLSPGFQTAQAPAACVFNNLLYVFWTDLTTSQMRFSASEDGLTWP